MSKHKIERENQSETMRACKNKQTIAAKLNKLSRNSNSDEKGAHECKKTAARAL